MASDVNGTGNDGRICAETVRPMVEKLGRWIADNALKQTGTPEFREAARVAPTSDRSVGASITNGQLTI